MISIIANIKFKRRNGILVNPTFKIESNSKKEIIQYLSIHLGKTILYNEAPFQLSKDMSIEYILNECGKYKLGLGYSATLGFVYNLFYFDCSLNDIDFVEELEKLLCQFQKDTQIDKTYEFNYLVLKKAK